MVRMQRKKKGWRERRLKWVEGKAVKRGDVGKNCAVNTYFAD